MELDLEVLLSLLFQFVMETSMEFSNSKHFIVIIIIYVEWYK